MYYLLLSGTQPKVIAGDTLYIGFSHDNFNIKISCYLLSSFLAQYYPDMFGNKLKEYYLDSKNWLQLLDVYYYYFIIVFFTNI